MVMNPDVLIADEPLSSLDASLKANVLQYLIELWKKRKDSGNPLTMIIISHDIGTISRICSRAIIMYGDHINKRGDIVEDFSYPSNFDYLGEGSYHPYTKNLISAAKYFREHEEQDEDDNKKLEKKLTPNQGCVYGSVCSDKSRECEDSPQYKEIINDKGHLTTCVKQV
jgi:ABC-type dipeptide/oligopeptide/nickel transport system ATPase component